MTYGRTWHAGRVVRHHNLITATQPNITGPINKGRGKSNTAGKGQGKGNGRNTFVYDSAAYYNHVALQIDATGQADGTGYTTDESRHGHTLTYVGNATISSEKFEFDGTGDYITIPDTPLWTPTRFTMEWWGLEFDDSVAQVLASQYGSATELSWSVTAFVSGDISFAGSTGGTTADASQSSSYSPSTGTPINLMISWDGTTIYFYVNGDLVDSFAYTPILNRDSTLPLRIGADDLNGTPRRFLNGRFSAFRYTKGVALVAGQSRYTPDTLPLGTTQSSTTDSNWDDVVLLATANDDGTIWDDSPYDWPLRATGTAAVSTSVEPFSDANSFSFDGNSDWIDLPDAPELEFGSGDFTVEFNARIADNTIRQEFVNKYKPTTDDRSWAFGYRGNEATDVLRELTYSAGTSTPVFVNDSGTFTPTNDTFYHYALCRDGSNHRIFVDGTQSGSTGTSSAAVFDGDGVISIGVFGIDAPAHYVNGYISEVRITKAARYTSGFTAPSAKYPRG